MVAYCSEYSSKNEGGTSEPFSAAFASQKISDYIQMGTAALLIPLPENVMQAIRDATLQHLEGEQRGALLWASTEGGPELR